MTFSIVAHDRHASPSPEWGIAVASKFLAVGSCVPWARAGIGAIATQALANVAYGPDGLGLLADGLDAAAVVATLTGRDEGRQHRQLGVVDTNGAAATFTGDGCYAWAGGVVGEGFCCQGNILTGPEVVAATAAAFERSEGELARRLLAALEAGDGAGGDSRGRQSAALLVVREGGGYDGGNDIAVDLRVDDHPLPVPELQRLFDIHRMLMPRPEDLDFIPLRPDLVRELRTLLVVPGGDEYDVELKDALRRFAGTENLEERWTEDDRIERGVLEYLRSVRAPRVDP